MKFILIVLIIHFIGEMIMSKIQGVEEDIDERNNKVLHPAEFQVRTEG